MLPRSIPPERLLDDPVASAALAATRVLRDSGFTALLAGGAVRDLLLGRAPLDYDIATDAAPAEVGALFPRSHAVGARFGVVVVVHREVAIEVTSFRREGPYPDGRRPAWVAPGTVATDAARRDFTINGMYLDPGSGQVIDLVGGLADLEARLVRAIGDPAERFREDHLRILRAVRLASQLEFQIDPATLAAARESAALVGRVSAERVRDELSRLLSAPRPGRSVRLLEEVGLVAILLPELAALKGVEQPPTHHPEGDVYTHTLLMMDALASPPLDLAWSVLLHDVGKPLTSMFDETADPPRIRFPGHEARGAEIAAGMLARLRYPREFIERVTLIVRQHMQFKDVPQMRGATLRRLLARPTFPLELELHRLDCLASHGDLSAYHALLDLRQAHSTEELDPAPLLRGTDLLARGVAPGPIIGRLLRQARDLQLEGVLRDRDQALAWLARALAAGPAPR